MEENTSCNCWKCVAFAALDRITVDHGDDFMTWNNDIVEKTAGMRQGTRGGTLGPCRFSQENSPSNQAEPIPITLAELNPSCESAAYWMRDFPPPTALEEEYVFGVQSPAPSFESGVCRCPVCDRDDDFCHCSQCNDAADASYDSTSSYNAPSTDGRNSAGNTPDTSIFDSSSEHVENVSSTSTENVLGSVQDALSTGFANQNGSFGRDSTDHNNSWTDSSQPNQFW